jgi:uracil-DNA glycosylase
MTDLDAVSAAARACVLCAADLPLGPRPVFRVSSTARVLIMGQAPGTKVHESGIPWNDASGVRLRAWMRMAPEQFYDVSRIAILPVGLCYPGVLPKGGDKPPMPVCAPLWHPRLLPLMPELRLTLLVGGYAQAAYLGRGAMTARVQSFRDHLPRFLPLPHPSWRTTGWERRNPWFTEEVLPELRAQVALALGNV